MTPEIRELVGRYREAVAELNSIVLGHGRPDTRRAANRQVDQAARDVAASVLFELDREHPEHAHLWKCGCLRNDGGAHRVGCPDHPEGVRGDRLS